MSDPWSVSVTVTSILDIDLDYYNLLNKPDQRLGRLLKWSACPVSCVVRSHHIALRRWRACLEERALPEPRHILHVDEHHDMMDENPAPNIANFLFHAMRLWPDVRVHWLFEQAIDSPAMWLSDESWRVLRRRFSSSPHRPRSWPRPQIVSVCTSPGFVRPGLRERLMEVVAEYSPQGRGRVRRAAGRLRDGEATGASMQ
jgi:hypothetical protein